MRPSLAPARDSPPLARRLQIGNSKLKAQLDADRRRRYSAKSPMPSIFKWWAKRQAWTLILTLALPFVCWGFSAFEKAHAHGHGEHGGEHGHGAAGAEGHGGHAEGHEEGDQQAEGHREVRHLARSLRPVVLDQVGLSAGLETLVRDFNKKGGTFCGLHLDPLPELQDAMRTDLFRIVQEALTNVQRHANANLAYVRLFASDGALRLEIGDDGQGIQVDETASDATSMGIGMIGMRERVRNHGGEIHVQSTPGSGTAIEVNLPLSATL